MEDSMTSSSWQQTESDNSSMRLHLSAPDGAGPFFETPIVLPLPEELNYLP